MSNDPPQWASRTVGGGAHKCKWCGTHREYIKTDVPPSPHEGGQLIWFCPNCDSPRGKALAKGDG